MNRIQVILIGDSDIARWPPNLWPCIETSAVSHSGQNGAILRQIVPYVDAMLTSVKESPASKIFVVLCCGENDVGEGIKPKVSKEIFASILNSIMDLRDNMYVIALGPKIEPCMENDKETRSAYLDLSKRFHWECKHHRVATQISYFDCLTMFCKGNDGKKKLKAEKAMADPLYFDRDGLHLSNEGYDVWKEKVEEFIEDVMTQP